MSFAPNAERDAYIPEVPTVSELETAYKEGKLKPSTGVHSAEEIKKWSQELVGIAPRNQRFLEFNKTPVDANPYQADQTKNKIHMLVRDGNGLSPSDKAIEAEILKSQKSLKEVAEGRDVLGKDIKTISPKDLNKDDKVTYDALTEARSLLNERLAADFTKDGKRVPAGDEIAKTEKDKSDPKGKDGKKLDDGGLKAKREDAKAQRDDGRVDSTAEATASGRAAADQSRDLQVQKQSARTPSGFKKYGDEERVKVPEQIQNSRYIRYDLNQLFTEIQDSTK